MIIKIGIWVIKIRNNIRELWFWGKRRTDSWSPASRESSLESWCPSFSGLLVARISIRTCSIGSRTALSNCLSPRSCHQCVFLALWSDAWDCSLYCLGCFWAPRSTSSWLFPGFRSGFWRVCCTIPLWPATWPDFLWPLASDPSLFFPGVRFCCCWLWFLLLWPWWFPSVQKWGYLFLRSNRSSLGFGSPAVWSSVRLSFSRLLVPT